MSTKLRSYESAGISHVRQAFIRGVRRVLLVAPTGAGKTVMAAHLAKGFDGRVLFLFQRRVLGPQTIARFVDAGIPAKDVGLVLAGHELHHDRRVVVASVQTLDARRASLDLRGFDLVVPDEAHHVVPGSRVAALIDACGARYTCGLTATPQREDGKSLGASFDEMVEAATLSELFERPDWLSRPQFFRPSDAEMPRLRGVRIQGGEFERTAASAAMAKKVITGSIVRHYLKHANGRPAVLFAQDLERSRAYCRAFAKVGVRCEHIDGTTPQAERDAILARLESGKTQIVSNFDVLTEGFDAPFARVAIVARITWSLVKYLQMCGRVMRPMLGKDGAPIPSVILDHAGNCRHFGPPLIDRPWTLDEKQKTRKDRRGDMCKQCPECASEEWLPLSARYCPNCGHEFYEPEPVKEDEAGELVGEALTPEREAELLAWLVDRAKIIGLTGNDAVAWAKRAIKAGVR